MITDPGELRIFVVDDESIIASTLALILSKEGFKTNAFDLPLEALRFAREVPPDLLITDVMMPLISGIELAIQVREFCPDCKVLLISGQAGTVDLLHAARVRGDEFDLLQKPVFPEDLISEIRTMLHI